MHITLQSHKKRTKKRNRVQARFDRLRQRIEREQKKNAKLSGELDELVRWLESRRGEIEQGVLDASVRLTERLIRFFRRKTLAKWHREELVDWITEMGEQVSAIDADSGARLHQDFIDAMCRHFDLSEDELEATLRGRFESDQVEFDLGEAEFEDDPQGDLFEDDSGDYDDDLFGDAFHDEREAAGEWDGPFNEDWARAAGGNKAEPDRASNLTNAGWLRNLFRRAAQALHPDRETDPEQRARKQEKMQALVKARKDGDVLAMLELYADASGETDMALAEEEMKQACTLMERNLEQLQQQLEEIVLQSPDHAMAYDEFYRISRKRREQKLKRWEREAEAEAKRLARIVGELKNLDALKDHLRRRREESLDALQSLDHFFEDLMRR
jgi:hypothetical protein